ncbi:MULTISPECIES: XdhC family protein [Cytobacillus]|uniref:XdhC family protein n=1 Tax=Cytobacillus TaxID=2675230 RepID=UPI001CD6EFF0|nr:XdhC family protein [Cytobacillus kochii]MCA1028170.1 XdhC family protein [Cytobacillus kochii]MCM3321144.1 XdhC family protein [Cytobacillus kochii]MCM3344023.1 XdhC family protein [Cytobacillus kochii]MDM5207868.1 XdhC family protein [Cytobacillus kochii]
MTNEQLEVMRAIQKLKAKKLPCALATVIKVKGSAYRKEGAKMLIDADGVTVGLISGGCLEADVAEIAKEVIKTKAPIIKTYHLDEDEVWGLGLGCPGTVHIYIEPIIYTTQNIEEVDECAKEIGAF